MADKSKEVEIPPQHQEKQPGIEKEMDPRPAASAPEYRGSGKLRDKVCIVTGGDSGIGRATAILFAREGASVTIAYLDEDEDAKETCKLIEKEGQKCDCFRGDLGDEETCRRLVKQVADKFGRIDVLVNNAAEQHEQANLEDISAEQLERTFRTNIFAYFFVTKAALPHMKQGASIINTTSVTAYQGSEKLLDYSSTKGAIVAFTRSLALNLVDRGIRVNGVAPGPIWTPLIPASFSEDRVSSFGEKVPMHRAGQPEECAPCFVFLASQADSSYISGQILHPNGGTIVNG